METDKCIILTCIIHKQWSENLTWNSDNDSDTQGEYTYRGDDEG